MFDDFVPKIEMNFSQEFEIGSNFDEDMENEDLLVQDPVLSNVAQFETDQNFIWHLVAQAVTRTMLYVDKQQETDIDWLYSPTCDLNDLEKNLLSAFNIDVRKSPLERTNIIINHHKQDYQLYNGVFYNEVKKMTGNKMMGALPCFGMYSLVSNRPK